MEARSNSRGTERTDEELVTRVLAGEAHLYEVLMRRHNQRLYRAIRGVLPDDDEVEDVMQEAYVDAFAHLASFRSEAKFSTWLTRIAVYAAFARARKTKWLAYGQENEEREAEQPTPEQAVSDRELGSVLERAIDALPEPFRAVFVLRAIEGLSTAETARVLDVGDDTVKTRLHRARAMLQKSVLAGVDAATPEVFGFHLSRCDRVVNGVLVRLGIVRPGIVRPGIVRVDGAARSP